MALKQTSKQKHFEVKYCPILAASCLLPVTHQALMSHNLKDSSGATSSLSRKQNSINNQVTSSQMKGE